MAVGRPTRGVDRASTPPTPTERASRAGAAADARSALMPRPVGPRLAAVGLLLLACACSSDKGGLERPEADGPRIPYTVAFEGEMPGNLRTLLEGASASRRLEDRPPSSQFALAQRAHSDVPQLVAALHSEGYYAGRVEYRIGPAAGRHAAVGAGWCCCRRRADHVHCRAGPSVRVRPIDHRRDAGLVLQGSHACVPGARAR